MHNSWKLLSNRSVAPLGKLSQEYIHIVGRC